MEEKEKNELLTFIASSSMENYSLKKWVIGLGLANLTIAIVQIILLLLK